MKLDVPLERPREISRPVQAPESAPLVESSPLDQRLVRLRELVEQPRPSRFPGKVRTISPPRDKARHVEREPRRSRRDREPEHAIGLHLRNEERNVLLEVGRFRVIRTEDLRETIYGGDRRALESDLRFLKEKGFISIDQVNARRDGRRETRPIEVVSLTKEGAHLAYAVGSPHPDQRLYHGLVKLREAEHDSAIYQAYRKEWQRIEEREGGVNPRIKLDFELKAAVHSVIYAERKAAPERDLAEIRRQVAQEQNLPIVNGRVEFPDARIEYDREPGGQTGSSDIEVATAAYRAGHLQGKVQAGFRVYASGSDRSRFSAQVENDHRLMEQILDL